MNAQFFKTRPNEVIEPLHITRKNSFIGISHQTNNSKIEAQTLKVERYARVCHHVLLTGERGTGKTTIARQISRQKPTPQKTICQPELCDAQRRTCRIRTFRL